VRAGIARTPQRTVLFDRMSPLVQAAVGAHAAHRVSFGAVRHLLVTPSARRRQAAIARQGRDALDAVGLVPLAGVDPATLTTRQQRLLQVARIAATGADVLLLDEPSAGVGVGDKQLGEVIRDLARNGAAVCVVEHDMRLVAAVADRVTVLDAGRVLATGPPESVRQDPAVRRAYLGDDVAEPA
jgi:ABC-type branched-subunit amino acid transport system ATPase component